MSFKLTPPFEKNPPPVVNVPMEEGVLGRADKKGCILVNKDIKDPKQMTDTVNHENVHMQQMKRGELDYDEKNVYFKGKKYPRSKFNEANKQLPWEIDAYKAG